MNESTKGAEAPVARAHPPIRLRQEIRATSEDVQRMVSHHYADRGVDISPAHVSIEAVGGGGHGYSSSQPSFLGVTMRFFGEQAKKAQEDGLPTTMKLAPEAVAAIVAKRLSLALGTKIPPALVRWEVSGGGGSGFSSSGPSLRSAVVRLDLEV